MVVVWAEGAHLSQTVLSMGSSVLGAMVLGWLLKKRSPTASPCPHSPEAGEAAALL